MKNGKQNSAKKRPVMNPKDHQFPNGLTVTELKAIVADWPEVNHLGEPTEVWIETGKSLTSWAVEVEPLNYYKGAADLLISSLAFESESVSEVRLLDRNDHSGTIPTLEVHVKHLRGTEGDQREKCGRAKMSTCNQTGNDCCRNTDESQ